MSSYYAKKHIFAHCRPTNSPMTFSIAHEIPGVIRLNLMEGLFPTLLCFDKNSVSPVILICVATFKGVPSVHFSTLGFSVDAFKSVTSQRTIWCAPQWASSVNKVVMSFNRITKTMKAGLDQPWPSTRVMSPTLKHASTRHFKLVTRAVRFFQSVTSYRTPWHPALAHQSVNKVFMSFNRITKTMKAGLDHPWPSTRVLLSTFSTYHVQLTRGLVIFLRSLASYRIIWQPALVPQWILTKLLWEWRRDYMDQWPSTRVRGGANRLN